MNNTLAALLLAVALPAAAQNRAAEIDFENARAAAAGRAAADATVARNRALDTALVAMNDGPEAGGAVTRALEEGKISVEFAVQSEAAKTVATGGKTVILLSTALPAHPRVYAPLIAAQAAKTMFADMPACAERSYMRAATAARVFAELGGEFKSLPIVDGDKAEAVQTAVAAWSVDAQTALDMVGRADGVASLPDMEQAAKDPKTAAALQAADRRFVAFILDEREARLSAAR